MLNSVSFAARGIYDKADLNAPQGNARPASTPATPASQPAEAPKKSHKTAKVILGTLVAAAAVATALAVGSKKGAFNPATVAEKLGSLKDKSWLSWAKEPAKKALGAFNTAGEAINDAVKGVADKLPEGITKFFTKAKPETPAA